MRVEELRSVRAAASDNHPPIIAPTSGPTHG
jgi:hypothetical protein